MCANANCILYLSASHVLSRIYNAQDSSRSPETLLFLQLLIADIYDAGA
jgi:hypothetical protein